MNGDINIKSTTRNYDVIKYIAEFSIRKIFYFCLSILTKDMPDQISAKY